MANQANYSFHMETPSERDNAGVRPLTEKEREELLDQPLPGVWSTLMPNSRIHSVPIHFVRRDDELHVLAGLDSVKSRNAACERPSHPLRRDDSR